jgi:hypothetical protein
MEEEQRLFNIRSSTQTVQIRHNLEPKCVRPRDALTSCSMFVAGWYAGLHVALALLGPLARQWVWDPALGKPVAVHRADSSDARPRSGTGASYLCRCNPAERRLLVLAVAVSCLGGKSLSSCPADPLVGGGYRGDCGIPEVEYGEGWRRGCAAVRGTGCAVAKSRFREGTK